MLFAVDWGAIGTSASIIAALAALATLVVTLVRERKKVVVHGERWSPDRMGREMYVRVVATCEGRRPVTVRSIGVVLRITADGRRRTYDDGKATPPLPATLTDGDAVFMLWMDDELPEFKTRDAVIEEVFAIYGANQRVSRPWTAD